MDNGAGSYRRFLDGDDKGIAEIVGEYKDGLILFLNGYVGSIFLAEELTEETGITLNVPITAVDVTYSYIDGDKEPLAQVSFVYQGQTYTYRGQKTQTVQDISGMYYTWTKTTNDSEDVPYTCYFTDEGQGMALWHTDGISYTLGMTENVTEELLVTMYGIVTGEAE